MVDGAVKNAQGQFRTIKDALKCSRGRRIEGDHPAAPWMMTHTASVINKGRKDDEGFTAYRRWSWRKFAKPLAEFGECVACAPALSAGKGKFDVRWKEGVELNF